MACRPDLIFELLVGMHFIWYAIRSILVPGEIFAQPEQGMPESEMTSSECWGCSMVDQSYMCVTYVLTKWYKRSQCSLILNTHNIRDDSGRNGDHI